jgi:hypothetical protein
MCQYIDSRGNGDRLEKHPSTKTTNLLSFKCFQKRYLSLQHAGVVVAPLPPQLLTFLGDLNNFLVDGLDLRPVLLQKHQINSQYTEQVNSRAE